MMRATAVVTRRHERLCWVPMGYVYAAARRCLLSIFHAAVGPMRVISVVVLAQASVRRGATRGLVVAMFMAGSLLSASPLRGIPGSQARCRLSLKNQVGSRRHVFCCCGGSACPHSLPA